MIVDITGQNVNPGDVCLYSKSSKGALIPGVVGSITHASVVMYNIYEPYKYTQHYLVPIHQASIRLMKLVPSQVLGLSTTWLDWFEKEYPAQFKAAKSSGK